jgi:hypothetical protein
MPGWMVSLFGDLESAFKLLCVRHICLVFHLFLSMDVKCQEHPPDLNDYDLR